MRTIALCLMFAASACLASTDDQDDTGVAHPEEPAGAARLAVTQATPSPGQEAETWRESHIPEWAVYLGESGRDRHRESWNNPNRVYYDAPDDSDAGAPIIAVRKGDERTAERWVRLSLVRHWMTGDAYFERLVDCGIVTVLDLVMIHAALAAHDRSHEPPAIATLPAATPRALWDVMLRSRTGCPSATTPHAGQHARMFDGAEGTIGPPLPPDWQTPGNDHTGPAPGRGGGRGSGSPQQPGALPGWDPWGDKHAGGHGSPGAVYGSPSTGGINSHSADLLGGPSYRGQLNGIERGDPPAIPAPSDAWYEPRKGEQKEAFKCEGRVQYGYKSGCADWSAAPVTEKWSDKLVRFFDSTSDKIEAFRVSLAKTLIDNGTHKDCENHCVYFGIVPVAAVSVLSAVLFKNPQVLAGAGAASGGAIAKVFGDRCVKNICNGGHE